ncbi:MAG: hypothetical protein QM734_09305 [Cyclobacteriaceae bacterium]
MSNKIKGSVGAGNFVIYLPNEEVPVLVKIHDSWLCSVNLSNNLKKIGENTFANAAYNKNSKEYSLHSISMYLWVRSFSKNIKYSIV